MCVCVCMRMCVLARACVCVCVCVLERVCSYACHSCCCMRACLHPCLNSVCCTTTECSANAMPTIQWCEGKPSFISLPGCLLFLRSSASCLTQSVLACYRRGRGGGCQAEQGGPLTAHHFAALKQYLTLPLPSLNRHS